MTTRVAAKTATRAKIGVRAVLPARTAAKIVAAKIVAARIAVVVLEATTGEVMIVAIAGAKAAAAVGGGGRGPGGDRRNDAPFEIDIDKLIADSLYLDNQAHVVVSRMRDMDSGTKSQLRRLYNAVRRATRAPETERQHEFVMVRARLAYTIARHSLRSLDALERLLLQVTRKNDSRGYERFRDLFEAIIAYNE